MVKRLDEQDILMRLKAKGQKTPVEFMVAIMCNKNATAGLRLEAAKAAAPYIHKKQPMAIDHSGEMSWVPPFVPSRGELAKQYRDELPDDYQFDEDDSIDDL